MHDATVCARQAALPGACCAPADRGDQALEEQVQNALNLFLTLKCPAQMPALLQILDQVKPRIQAALSGLRRGHRNRRCATASRRQSDCLGAPLARKVAPVGLRTLLQRLPGLRLAGLPQWQTDPYLRSVVNLPVAID